MKVKYVKLMQENIWKFYLQVITDACVKIVVVELCFEKKTKETFEKCLARFCRKKIFQKFIWEKIEKKLLSHLPDFGH